MAPINFEDNMKKKLDEREITPSSQAWERIEAQLQEGSSKKFPWLLVAASIAGIILIGSLVLTKWNNTDDQTTPQLVETSIAPVETVDEIGLSPKVNTEVAEQDVVEKVTELERSEKPKEIQEQFVEPKIKKQEEQVAETNAKELETSIKSDSEKIPSEEEAVITAKVTELIAQVENLEQSGEAVTDAEIDSLLKAAQRDIIRHKNFRNARGNVNATALLREVEEELDPSFRERIFEALKNGFNQAREAVASRNN